ncbi:MAG: DUF4286 family protein [Arenimonas sp.]
MIVYEVNLFVQRDIAPAFRPWLDSHVREILALPGFLGAEVFERTEPPADAGELVLCTQYRLRDAAALATYLREHAPRLRADGVEKFGGRFRADRRVLTAIARY